VSVGEYQLKYRTNKGLSILGLSNNYNRIEKKKNNTAY
jgi:hypothetical protein